MKKGGGASKKSNEKKAQKIVEDKTFGMKNKNSKKNQKTIQGIKNSVTGNLRKQQSNANQQLSKKQIKAQRDEEMKMLGINREYERKPQEKVKGSAEEMGESLKSESYEKSLEDRIEEARSKLGSKLTPVTLETFEIWKRQRGKDGDEYEMRRKKREKDNIYGHGGMSGRELFEHRRTIFVDDERAVEEELYKVDRDEELVMGLEEQARLDCESRGELFDAVKFLEVKKAFLKSLKDERDERMKVSLASMKDERLEQQELKKIMEFEKLHIEDESLFMDGEEDLDAIGDE